MRLLTNASFLPNGFQTKQAPRGPTMSFLLQAYFAVMILTALAGKWRHNHPDGPLACLAHATAGRLQTFVALLLFTEGLLRLSTGMSFFHP